MKTKMLRDVLERIDDWPPAAQDALAEVALEFEAEVQGVYHASPEELAGIARGLRDAAEGRVVGAAEVEAVFAKYRRK